MGPGSCLREEHALAHAVEGELPRLPNQLNAEAKREKAGVPKARDFKIELSGCENVADASTANRKRCIFSCQWLKERVLDFIQNHLDYLSVQFSCSIVSDSLRPHGLQHGRLPCSSPTPGAFSNSCPLRKRCHPTISSSVIPFSSCLQSFSESVSFPMSCSSHQVASIGASASALVPPMNIQD